jgi:type IV pilus assembly protein PilV
MESNSDNRGFTLIEMMVAIVILMIGMLGLLQAINLALEVNLRNQLREEGVNVAERVMNELKGQGFDAIPASSTLTIPSKIRGSTRNYTVQANAVVLASDPVTALPTTKRLEVTTEWSYKGVTYRNRISAPVSIVR